MKTAVSVPDELFDEAETVAARLGLNRSQLYARALRAFLAAAGLDPVTERLNQFADEAGDDGAAGLGTVAARQMIDSGRWEW